MKLLMPAAVAAVIALLMVSIFLVGRGKLIDLGSFGTYDSEDVEVHNQQPHVYQNVTRIQRPHVYHNVTRIFYNRVPKCGSSTTRALFKQLGSVNGWKLLDDLRYFERITNKFSQLWLENVTQVEEVAHHVLSRQTPSVYDGHIHYIHFPRYCSECQEEPLLINLIRDPLERLMSWYYFERFHHKRLMSSQRRLMSYAECVEKDDPECTAPNPTGYFTLVPYFCGHDPICLYPNPTALTRAKQHASRYAVIGVLEMYEDFLYVLEKTVPGFFTGAVDVYKSRQEQGHGKSMVNTYVRPNMTAKATAAMHSLLTMEYEFYEFIKKSLIQQKYLLQKHLSNTTNQI